MKPALCVIFFVKKNDPLAVSRSSIHEVVACATAVGCKIKKVGDFCVDGRLKEDEKSKGYSRPKREKWT
jgi:hypothetical protein